MMFAINLNLTLKEREINLFKGKHEDTGEEFNSMVTDLELLQSLLKLTRSWKNGENLTVNVIQLNEKKLKYVKESCKEKTKDESNTKKRKSLLDSYSLLKKEE